MNITTEPRFAKVKVIMTDKTTLVKYINMMEVHSINPGPFKSYENAAKIEFVSAIKQNITITDVGDLDI